MEAIEHGSTEALIDLGTLEWEYGREELCMRY